MFSTGAFRTNPSIFQFLPIEYTIYEGPFYPDFERLKKFSIKSDFLIFGPVKCYPL